MKLYIIDRKSGNKETEINSKENLLSTIGTLPSLLNDDQDNFLAWNATGSRIASKNIYDLWTMLPKENESQ